MVEAKREKPALFLQVLGGLCESVNRVSTKRQSSYKLAEVLVQELGYMNCNLNYINSYVYKDNIVDVYKIPYTQITVYAQDTGVIGFKIKEPTYACKKYIKEKLTEFSMLETRSNIICERNV